MNLGTHMPDGERRKPVDIEVCQHFVLKILSGNEKSIKFLFYF
jgi:hypothetical protein